MKTSKDPGRKPVEKNVWVEVTNRKAKDKKVAALPMAPSPICIVPPLKEEGCSQVQPPLVVAKVVGHSPPVRGKDSNDHYTFITERKILLNKIYDLQLLRKSKSS